MLNHLHLYQPILLKIISTYSENHILKTCCFELSISVYDAQQLDLYILIYYVKSGCTLINHVPYLFNHPSMQFPEPKITFMAKAKKKKERKRKNGISDPESKKRVQENKS